MPMRRSATVVALTAALLSCRGCSDRGRAAPPTSSSAEPAQQPLSAAPDAPVELEAEPYRERAKVPALAWAAVTREHSVADAVGLADVEASVVATPDTPFEAASIAKTIIATTVTQLVEEGLLSLDADVSSLVGFPVHHPRRGAPPITLRLLLTHTASLVDRPATMAPNTQPLGDFLRGYFADGGASVFLDAVPGRAYVYSNVGPSLAALAVERATNTPFAERARKSIFEPLGMSGTAFRASPASPAAPYSARGAGFLRHGPPSHALYPVVDLFASARDLARFAQAILRGGELGGHRILRAESVDAMLAIQVDAGAMDALGWQSRRFGTRAVLGHEGEDVGASTCLYIDRAAGVGAVVLTNGDAFQSGDPSRASAIGELVEALLENAPSLVMSASSR
jgi:CubicO group peptidase (beta-lactamase class C family)